MKTVLLCGLSKAMHMVSGWFILVLSLVGSTLLFSQIHDKKLQRSARLDRPKTKVKLHEHDAVTKITKDPVQKRRDQDVLKTNTLLDRFIVVPEYKLLFCYLEKTGCAMFNHFSEC